MKDKRNNEGAEAPHSSEPQKARPTGEFVVNSEIVEDVGIMFPRKLNSKKELLTR